MLAFLLSVCCLQAQGADRLAPKPIPAPEVVARAEAALEEAFRSREAKRIEAALEASTAVPHPSIVRRVARGLEDERREVKLAALQALRRLEHPEALEVLHEAAKDRKLMKVPDLAAAVLRGIGQHADPSSIAVLARDPFEPYDNICLRGRIFGLARIRTTESLEALLGILAVTAGPSDQRRIQPLMGDVRLGLILLTGVDQGNSPVLWESWWRDNRKTFRIPPEVPRLPAELREDWELYWGLPRTYDREPRREDRGQDPPPRRGE